MPNSSYELQMKYSFTYDSFNEIINENILQLILVVLKTLMIIAERNEANGKMSGFFVTTFGTVVNKGRK